MNPINRVGQKVVCLFDIEVLGRLGGSYRGAVPQAGETYTVDGFGETGMIEQGEAYRGRVPGIFLREIPPVRSRRIEDGAMEDLPWPISIFRPAFEGETDISELLALGNPTKVREDA